MITNPRARPKVTITNLTSGVTLEAMFAPSQLQEEVQVNWNRLAPLGLSHEVLQYQNTGNERFNLDLFFRANSPAEMVALHRARRFIKSLGYPSGAAEDVAGGAPPTFLVVWPNMLTMYCVAGGRIAFSHLHFNRQLKSRVMTATLPCEEKRDFRVTMEDVFEDNQLRFGGVPGIDIESEG